MAFKTTKKSLIEQYNKSNSRTPKEADYKEDIKTFSKYVAKGSRILDHGCNRGYSSYFLKKAGYSVTGVDINPEAIEEAAKKYGKEGIRFRLAGRGKISEQYDAVFSRNVLADLISVGGIKKLDKELERLYNSTRNGGIVYATTYVSIDADFKMKSKSLTEENLKRVFGKYFETIDSKSVEEKKEKGQKRRLILVGKKK